MGISVTCTELRPLTVYWDASMANMPVVFQHGRGIYLYAIDEDPHAGHRPAHLEVHRALTGKSLQTR